MKTVEANSQTPSNGLTLFGAAFCPFVHRVWIALEHLGIEYRYVEVDPYKKPAELIEVNPKGLVPSLKLEGKEGELSRGLAESTVILEYLHERFVDHPHDGRGANKSTLLPLLGDDSFSSDEAAYLRARARQVSHHLNNTLIPSFYRFLQAQEADAQINGAKEFVDNLRWFEDRLTENDEGGEGGDFFAGRREIGWVDVMIAPWAYRATNVLSESQRAGRMIDLLSR